jgi:hypothetical protein
MACRGADKPCSDKLNECRRRQDYTVCRIVYVPCIRSLVGLRRSFADSFNFFGTHFHFAELPSAPPPGRYIISYLQMRTRALGQLSQCHFVSVVFF